MNIDQNSRNGVTILKPEAERIDVAVASEFRNRLLDLIDQGQRNLVVDLSTVNFIDSSGLGALVSALKTLKANGGQGDVRLAHLQPSVVDLLEIIRLNRVFATYPSVDGAVESYS